MVGLRNLGKVNLMLTSPHVLKEFSLTALKWLTLKRLLISATRLAMRMAVNYKGGKMSVKGESYKSKAAKAKHEKGEGKKERMMEYGPKGKTKAKTRVAPKMKTTKRGSSRGR
jgi:hypothetical protein